MNNLSFGDKIKIYSDNWDDVDHVFTILNVSCTWNSSGVSLGLLDKNNSVIYRTVPYHWIEKIT